MLLLEYYCPDCDCSYFDLWECEVDHPCPQCGKDIQPEGSIELKKGFTRSLDEVVDAVGELLPALLGQCSHCGPWSKPMVMRVHDAMLALQGESDE